MEMNTVNIIGNLTRDIELRYSQAGKAVTSSGIAVRRNYSNVQGEYESDFINIKAFGKTAELLASHFRKGSKIGITGRIQTGRYENKEGQTIYTTDVVVDNVTFVEHKNRDTDVSSNKSNNHNRNIQNGYNGQSSSFGGNVDVQDDDLPF